jgi:hypothetical protein
MSEPSFLVSLGRKAEKLLKEVCAMSEQYKPGQKVPWSGIYKVVHDRNHVQEHEVTCVKDEVFPPCNGCGPHPRFTLVRAAHHIFNHENFRK